MGLGRRLVRKSVRKVTPRAVRRAAHPVRTVKNAITPRPVKKLSRAVYTATNPLGAVENKLIGAALHGGKPRRGSARPRQGQAARTTARNGGVRSTETAIVLAVLSALAQLAARAITSFSNRWLRR